MFITDAKYLRENQRLRLRPLALPMSPGFPRGVFRPETLHKVKPSATASLFLATNSSKNWVAFQNIHIKKSKTMAMTIKTSPELWGEDAIIFTEEAERNGKLPTPTLSESQRKLLSTMLESLKGVIFPLVKVDNGRI